MPPRSTARMLALGALAAALWVLAGRPSETPPLPVHSHGTAAGAHAATRTEARDALATGPAAAAPPESHAVSTARAHSGEVAAPQAGSATLLRPATAAERERVTSWASQRSVIRERLVHLDVDRLRSAAPAADRADATALLELDLFDDADFDVVLEGEDPLAAGSSGRAWWGSVAGIPGSSVTLAVQGDAAHALVQLPGGERYAIAYAGNGVHRVIELDPAALPPEHVPVAAAPVDLGAAPTGGATVDRAPAAGAPVGGEGEPPAPAAPAGGSTVIDLMVLYTAEARAAAGGQDAIESRIQQAVALANQAYVNSQVSIQHQLVYMGLAAYTEPTSDAFYQSLSDLTYTTDGYMDDIHALRNAVGADVVSLLIDDWTYCGLGWINDPTAPWSSSWAFNVSLWYCVGGSRTLHHEIGHNQGLNHDVDNAGSGAVFPYSYGLQVDGGFHTVMAYDSRYGCATPCPPANHFSNPNVSYLGLPTGIAEQADNARSLNETRAFVAAWRARFQPDQDQDGVADEDDNCLALPNPGQVDSDADGFGNACDGDLNNDGFVTALDMVPFRAGLAAFRPPAPGDTDLNSDGFVNALDMPYFLAQLAHFRPGPSGLACAGTSPCSP